MLYNDCAMGKTIRGSNPSRYKNFFLQILLTPIFSGYRDSFPGIKRSGRIDDYSRSVSEIKNEWSCTSSPIICLRDVDRDKFITEFFFSNVRTDFMCNLRCMSVFESLNWSRIASLIVNCGSEHKSFRWI